MNTPIYHKTKEPFEWPDDPFFYLVAKEGIYQCRNHMFFRSCVLAKSVSGVLPHKESVIPKYPRMPKELLQKVVGFFGFIADKYDTECIVLLVYNMQSKAVEIVCPKQWVDSRPSMVNKGQWYTKADIKYEVPILPPHLLKIGDIHSHIKMAAYHSFMDKADEEHRPGIHVTIGRIDEEPPDMCASIVVDGVRFVMDDMMEVIEDYDARASFPAAWLDQFSIKKLKESPHITNWDKKKASVQDNSKAYDQWQVGMESAEAESAILIIFHGNKGHGFSVQATLPAILLLPDTLREIADQIEAMHREGKL